MSDFEQLANAIDLRDKTVVDIGCGDGAFVRALASAGATAIGIEVSEDAVARARERDPDHRYERGGAERLPLADQSVDVATLMRSLHHVPDPASAFPELRRVVREYVWIAEPLPEGDFFELLRPVDDETEVRADAQRAIAEQDGFDRVETIEYDVTLPVPTFEALRDRVLAADPTRAERFAAVEGDLRGKFTPGDYVVPMRADCSGSPAGEDELAVALELARVDAPLRQLGGDRVLVTCEQAVDDAQVAVAGQPRLGGVTDPFGASQALEQRRRDLGDHGGAPRLVAGEPARGLDVAAEQPRDRALLGGGLRELERGGEDMLGVAALDQDDRRLGEHHRRLDGIPAVLVLEPLADLGSRESAAVQRADDRVGVAA